MPLFFSYYNKNIISNILEKEANNGENDENNRNLTKEINTYKNFNIKCKRNLDKI